MDRVLLRSIKPALHANVDCTPLVAAIVSRQVPVVNFLLEVMSPSISSTYFFDLIIFELMTYFSYTHFFKVITLYSQDCIYIYLILACF